MHAGTHSNHMCAGAQSEPRELRDVWCDRCRAVGSGCQGRLAEWEVTGFPEELSSFGIPPVTAGDHVHAGSHAHCPQLPLALAQWPRPLPPAPLPPRQAPRASAYMSGDVGRLTSGSRLRLRSTGICRGKAVTSHHRSPKGWGCARTVTELQTQSSCPATRWKEHTKTLRLSPGCPWVPPAAPPPQLPQWTLKGVNSRRPSH